jgi:GNAT superfamily N-acetyltransferase
MQIRTLDRLDQATRRALLQLNATIYADDPYYIAGPDVDILAGIAQAVHDKGAVVLAVERAGRLCARAIARIDETAATIGGFEALDDPEACQVLLATAEAWLQERGAKRVLGPMDGDPWHRYRFVLEPHRAPPFLKEPWNPSYYPARWEACGYQVVDRYTSSRIPQPEAAAANLEPYRRRVCRQGYRFRELDPKRLADELALMYRLSVEIFSTNRHYRAISQDEFIDLYAGVRPLLLPGLCQFCYAPDGTPVGFVFCYPDYADAVRAMRGKRHLVAKCRFLLSRRRAHRVCIKSLGVLPAYRGTGVGPALMGVAFAQTVAHGYEEALMCLMHAVNDSRRLDGGCSEPFRDYVLYTKAIGAMV